MHWNARLAVYGSALLPYCGDEWNETDTYLVKLVSVDKLWGAPGQHGRRFNEMDQADVAEASGWRSSPLAQTSPSVMKAQPRTRVGGTRREDRRPEPTTTPQAYVQSSQDLNVQIWELSYNYHPLNVRGASARRTRPRSDTVQPTRLVHPIPPMAQLSFHPFLTTRESQFCLVPGPPCIIVRRLSADIQ